MNCRLSLSGAMEGTGSLIGFNLWSECDVLLL